jgi:Flp pilus assembly protein TadG
MTRPTRDERGTATVFVIGMAVVLLACAGLVIDGGKALNARMALADNVEQAARLGANQIDLDALRSGGQLRIEPAEAQSQAGSFLGRLGYSGITVTANERCISVGARDTVPTAMLQLIGIGSYDISATATARASTSVDDTVQC